MDVQNTRHQQILDNQIVNDIPSGRGRTALAVLVPGLTVNTTQDVDGSPGLAYRHLLDARRPHFEGRLQVDGMGRGGALGGAGVSFYVPDVGNSEEITFTTSGGLGEADKGGPVMSVVPRTGGNAIRGMLFANGASGDAGDNFTQALRDAGLRLPATLRKLWTSTARSAAPSRTIGCGILHRAPPGEPPRVRTCTSTGTPATRTPGPTSLT